MSNLNFIISQLISFIKSKLIIIAFVPPMGKKIKTDKKTKAAEEPAPEDVQESLTVL